MESEREHILAQLRETERGEAASWVVYQQSPPWWALMFGGWTVLYVLAIGLLAGLPQAGASFALAFFMIGVISWERRRRGTWPTGRAPQEIKRLMTRLFAGAAAVALATWLTGETIGVVAAALGAGVAVTALVHWYASAYDRAAAAVRDRLA